MKHFSLILLGGLALGLAVPAHAQRDPLPDPGLTDSVGLVRSWFIHVNVDRQRAAARQTRLHTSRTRYFTVYRVNYQGRGVEFSERQVGPDGQPIGRAEAKRLADIKVFELTERGYQPQVETVEIPESTVYVQTNLGVLHAIDAHTGRTLWSRAVGRPFFPTVAPAANDTMVVTCTGSQLVWLDAQTGRTIYERPAAKIPFGNLAISSQFVFLPTLDGTMEVYRHTDQYARTPWRLHSEGVTRSAALVNDDYVAWLTDRGMLYVVLPERTGVLYDVQIDGPGVGSPILIAPGILGLATAHGDVYALDDRNGSLIWRFSTGSDILHTPLAVDGTVFVSTRTQGLYALNGEDGRQLWRTMDMDRALAVNQDFVYGTSTGGQLVRVSRDTGEEQGRVYLPEMELAIANTQTDRLFVGSRSGLLQCMHDVSLAFPLVYAERKEPADMPPPPPVTPTAPPPRQQPEPAEADQPVNPFEQLEPFGAPPTTGPPSPFDQPAPGEGPLPDEAPPDGEAPIPPEEAPIDPFGDGGSPFE
jgi:hypothetical protein